MELRYGTMIAEESGTGTNLRLGWQARRLWANRARAYQGTVNQQPNVIQNQRQQGEQTEDAIAKEREMTSSEGLNGKKDAKTGKRSHYVLWNQKLN